MKSGSVIIIVGIVMIIGGAVAFYSIHSSPDVEHLLRAVKHAGTFVGLMGIGVLTAGILLYLINRGQPVAPEDFDIE